MKTKHSKGSKSSRKRILWILLCIAAVLLLSFAVFWLWPRNDLIASRYEVTAQVPEAIRIVQLSDLHNREFGEGNCELIEAVRAERPDLIFMTGDMVTTSIPTYEPAVHLVSKLSEIAPVYYSYGNHETTWLTQYDTDLRALLEEAGAVVLDLEFTDLSVNGGELRIGGYFGYYGTPHVETHDPELQQKKNDFVRDFADTDRCKLLLCHAPTTWLDWNGIDRYDAGIVFCGHYHGGQVRIPIINRGVYAPYVGLFPKYTYGCFIGSRSSCILSTGLGTTADLPRIYNPPEICVVDLLPSRN